MGLGLGVLRLPPAQFWQMTPRELRAALEGAGCIKPAPDRPDRGTLVALMMRYPDGEGANHGG